MSPFKSLFCTELLRKSQVTAALHETSAGVRIIQLLLPHSGDVAMQLHIPPHKPWHNHWVLLSSHDLGSSSFTYNYCQVCKQKALFIFQLTHSGISLLFKSVGTLVELVFFCTTRCSKFSSSLLEGDRLRHPRHPVAVCSSFVACNYPAKPICNFADTYKPELTPSS